MRRGRAYGQRVIEYVKAQGDLLQCREIERQWESMRVCYFGGSMSTGTGVDNRELLPSFFPVYPNEDEIFSITLKRCWKNPDEYAKMHSLSPEDTWALQ